MDGKAVAGWIVRERKEKREKRKEMCVDDVCAGNLRETTERGGTSRRGESRRGRHTERTTGGHKGSSAQAAVDVLYRLMLYVCGTVYTVLCSRVLMHVNSATRRSSDVRTTYITYRYRTYRNKNNKLQVCPR